MLAKLGPQDVQEDDQWIYGAEDVVRIHAKQRKELFTPRRVAGAPACDELMAVRVTEGHYVDTGGCFKVIESWRKRSTAHREMPRPWMGSTKFLNRLEHANANDL